MLPRLGDVDALGRELLPSWDPQRRRRWLYRQVEEHGLPAIKFGRQLLFDTEAVARWLDEHSTDPGSATPAAAGIKASRDNTDNGNSSAPTN
jgi:excisionase family DNA binding protein